MKTHKTRYTYGDMVYVLNYAGTVCYEEVNEVHIGKRGVSYLVGKHTYKEEKTYDTIDDVLSALKNEFETRNKAIEL